jgi:nicotinamidase-related amidase
MPKYTVLLVIDVQVGLFQGNLLFEPQRLLDNINILLNKARSKGVPVVYIQHTSENEKSPFAAGNPMREIHPDIQPHPGDAVVSKSHPDSFQDTVLKEKLDALGIKKLVICGLQTEYCVDTTVRRAFSLGYEDIFVSDAHSTFDNGVITAPQIIAHHNTTIDGSFATLKKAQEVEF